MHLRCITNQQPKQANLRDTLEVTLLFLDVIGSAIAILTKTPFDSGHDDHDHDHGHTH